MDRLLQCPSLRVSTFTPDLSEDYYIYKYFRQVPYLKNELIVDSSRISLELQVGAGLPYTLNDN